MKVQRSDAEKAIRKQVTEDLQGVVNKVRTIREALREGDYWKASCELDTLVALSTMTREGVEKLYWTDADESALN